VMGDTTQRDLPIRSAENGTVVTLPDRPGDAVCSVVTLEMA
jgi:hypothetical protein